jgi:NADH-quinone oxidoreductase subunit N
MIAESILFISILFCLLLGLYSLIRRSAKKTVDKNHNSNEQKAQIYVYFVLSSVLAVIFCYFLFDFFFKENHLKWIEKSAFLAKYVTMFFSSQKDGLSHLFQFLILLSSLVSFLYLRKDKRFFEYPLLLVCSILGSLLLVRSQHYLSLFLSQELLSISLYILIASSPSQNYNKQMKQNSLNYLHSTQGAIKYFIMSSIGSAFFLFGLSLLYLSTNIKGLMLFNQNTLQEPVAILGIVFILCSFFLKIFIAPFHWFAPDIYESLSFRFLLFFSSVPKIGLFSSLYNFVSINSLFFNKTVFIRIFLEIVGCFSSVIGSFGALYQLKSEKKDIRRFVAYSSIAHMGWVILGMMAGSITFDFYPCVFYFFVYIFSTLLLFCSFAHTEEKETFTLQQIPFLSRFNLSILFVILLTYSGLPPFPGFFAKLFVVKSLLEIKSYASVFTLLFMSIISCYYYLLLLKYIAQSCNRQTQKSHVF